MGRGPWRREVWEGCRAGAAGLRVSGGGSGGWGEGLARGGGHHRTGVASGVRLARVRALLWLGSAAEEERRDEPGEGRTGKGSSPACARRPSDAVEPAVVHQAQCNWPGPSSRSPSSSFASRPLRLLPIPRSPPPRLPAPLLAQPCPPSSTVLPPSPEPCQFPLLPRGRPLEPVSHEPPPPVCSPRAPGQPQRRPSEAASRPLV